jgi:hypothetical protein
VPKTLALFCPRTIWMAMAALSPSSALMPKGTLSSPGNRDSEAASARRRRTRTRPTRPARVQGQRAILQRGAWAVDRPARIPPRRRRAGLNSHRSTVIVDSFALLRRESMTTLMPMARRAATRSSMPPRHQTRLGSPEAAGSPEDPSVGAAGAGCPGADGRGHAPMLKSRIPSR